ncbi:3219_t:CDS:1 [Diversispora eburnea]|uniref:3219_t:CDS:1 n=1 Tax=Diversispora eburnea TaxID=1213867 RepID=A0A9N9AWT0_9GLOM|nr:3219_t:CDS:1 [Diversispora eburnea]
MSSMKTFFIAILSIICLHVISSLAIPVSNEIKIPWIVANVAGKKFSPGQQVNLQIISPSERIININIRQRLTGFDQVLETNVKLSAGHNEIKVTIPSSGNFVKPSPQNYFTIFENGARGDYSATFEIGDPDYGISFIQPVAGGVIKVGDTLETKWKVEKSYVPPGADPSTFRVQHFLFEPAVIPQGQSFSSKFFPNDGVAVNFESGSLEYELPLDTIPNVLYKMGCLVLNTATTPWERHIYSAGTFLVIPK